MIEGGALRAGACLFIAGVLCCAGGIGGGGIYVTVLMVFGSLSVHDAIPLSKVVVFAASTPSLILNLNKTLIDWNLCRVVVPWALIGTLLGVFLNGQIPGKVIVGMLSIILVGITWMTIRTGYYQHCKEAHDEELAASNASSEGTDAHSGATIWPKQFKAETAMETSAVAKAKHDEVIVTGNELTNREVTVAVSMLITIIYCGTLHYHADRCALDIGIDGLACQHPVAQVVTVGQIGQLKASGFLSLIGMLAMVVAIAYCFLIGMCSAGQVLRQGQVYGSLHRFDSIGSKYGSLVVAFYIFMATATGCLAGLVGIGGGLIFSPVFIEMGLDVHVAVATSATCVIFTSSSTTFQYLLSDRIIVSLIFSFCIPHLLAAYTGTKLVHYIQDNYGAKKSWITCIVAVGVGISCILAISKLFATHSISD
jgi:uncharacterized membrane protein YfcA